MKPPEQRKGVAGRDMKALDLYALEKELQGRGGVSDINLVRAVLAVVSRIPVGKVASYGQIAALIGRERNARLVGKILHEADLYGDYPCHRVVNFRGRLAPGFPEQRSRLLRERVHFKEDGCVDLKKHRWDGKISRC